MNDEDAMETESDNQPDVEDNYLGLKILWECMLDSSPLDNNLSEIARNYTKILLQNTSFRQMQKVYLMKCVELI